MLQTTALLVVVCAAVLAATAVSKWLPFDSVVVFREKLNGALVTGVPMVLPSTWNWTLVVLADTFVVTEMIPETLAPEAGELIEIVGGVATVTELPQAGTAVLFENGEAITQFAGCGGIGGGGNFCEAGDSASSAGPSNVLLVIVTVPRPPPFQKLFAAPLESIALATLFEIRTGPHAGSDEVTFQT